MLPDRPQERPLIPGAQHAIFTLPGWRIRVAFVNGVSAAQEYRKELTSSGGFSIQPEELNSVLDAEKGSSIWKRDFGDPLHDPADSIGRLMLSSLMKKFRRSDGAVAESSGSMVVVTSPSGLRALAEAAKRASAERAERTARF